MAETLYFPTDDIRRYGSVSVVYGKPYPMPGYVPVTIIPHSHYSHWSEDIIGESNNLALAEYYGTMEDGTGPLVRVRYLDGDSLGYVGRYSGNDCCELDTTVSALEDYPLFDESHYSELELQRQNEYISGDGILDFHYSTDDRWEHETDEDIVAAIWQAISDIGAEWEGSGFYNWDDIVDLTEDILARQYMQPNVLPGQVSLW